MPKETPKTRAPAEPTAPKASAEPAAQKPAKPPTRRALRLNDLADAVHEPDPPPPPPAPAPEAPAEAAPEVKPDAIKMVKPAPRALSQLDRLSRQFRK